LFELDAQTGQLLWKLPVGGHDGHENDGLLTENAKPGSKTGLPPRFCLEPSIFGGIETQLASNGATTFAAVNDLALPASRTGYTAGVAADLAAIEKATGEMVAVNQDTGAVEWDTPLPSSPYGAATVTNDVVHLLPAADLPMWTGALSVLPSRPVGGRAHHGRLPGQVTALAPAHQHGRAPRGAQLRPGPGPQGHLHQPAPLAARLPPRRRRDGPARVSGLG
jgi:hypothetical protein